jgi:hypothetical protein
LRVRHISIARRYSYTVFNAEQIDGLPAHFYATVEMQNSDIAPLDAVERFFASTKASIQHGGSSAFYSPSRDIVQMPELKAFRDGESYYATLAHEMTHWTRHESRLDRDLGRKRFHGCDGTIPSRGDERGPAGWRGPCKGNWSKERREGLQRSQAKFYAGKIRRGCITARWRLYPHRYNCKGHRADAPNSLQGS